MAQMIRLGDVSIHVTRKSVKHVHLSVHPPNGRVTLVAPSGTRLEVARAYALTKLRWIRQQQAGFRSQAREAPLRYVERESHFVWGRRYLLAVREREAKPQVVLDHKRMTLTVRPGTSLRKRAEIVYEWQKKLLHAALPLMIACWERRLGVKVTAYFLQRMKTKWGSCNPRLGHIRINTALVHKPKDLLEYVVVHEMLHLIDPRHGERFVALLKRHYPNWQEARAELNELPLAT